MQENETYLTIKEALERFSMSRSFLYKLFDLNIVERHKVKGMQTLIKASELENWRENAVNKKTD